LQFASDTLRFMNPAGKEIHEVMEADDCVPLQCSIRADECHDSGIYLEMDVVSNPDTLTLAVVDWEAGGWSSLTFSPDSGLVFAEKTLTIEPRCVDGKYANALPELPKGQRFEGTVGLFIYAGRLAFFRRCRVATEEIWETTGFISDTSWAQGSLLTPCVAFRAAGNYNVRVRGIRREPPMPLAVVKALPSQLHWQGFNWD
jgi:hypothetical protein